MPARLTLVWLTAFVMSAAPIALWAGGGIAAQPGSAESFVRALYARYPLKEGAVGISFEANLARWFTSPLLPALQRENRYTATTHLIGGLDWDPLCECQDDDGLRLLSVHAHNTAPHAAMVDVRIWLPVSPGYQGQNEGEIRLFLLHTAQGWRISDIGGAGRKNLNGRSLAAKLAATTSAR